jgi:5'-AMP-activated protein kinase regulatory gamma subunit
MEKTKEGSNKKDSHDSLTKEAEAEKELEEQSPEEEDDVSPTATNYNTISSLAALKELLHGNNNSDESDEDMAWFQHYFLHHVNRLPKQELRSPYLRPILEGRRLSECREVEEEEEEAAQQEEEDEEDEDDDDDDDDDDDEKSEDGNDQATTTTTTTSGLEDTTSTSSSSSFENSNNTSNYSSAGSRKDSAVQQQHPPAAASLTRRHTVSTPTVDTGGTFPPLSPMLFNNRVSPLQSPHLDKRFFDSSLIEMKSQASSSSTIDYDSTEEVWIKRNDVMTETARRRKVSQRAGTGPFCYPTVVCAAIALVCRVCVSSYSI